MTRQHARSSSPYEASVGFSRGVRDGRFVAIAGTAPAWLDGEVDPDPGAQARRCWEIVLAALAELGGAPEHTLRTRQMVTDAAFAGPVAEVHRELFAQARPASTMVVVAGLLDPRWKVEVELDALLPEEPA